MSTDYDPSSHRANEDSRSPFGGAGGSVCASCGSSLGLAGPDGGCLTCLAQFALSPDDDGEEGELAAIESRSFGHFEVLSGSDGWPVRLGRGAMGVTYRARDTILRTEVALKVIGGGVAGHPAARAAFLREARAAARLRHPNVASVFHYGEQDGECFYVMELVEGETLEARLRREGPLPPTLVLEVGRQVASALMEAEVLGIVHRDLKPSNLMFVARRGERANDQPHVKVIDFGLAQAVDLAEAEDGKNTGSGGFIGTPSFASPEQFARDAAQPVDTRSDIYSLGVTLWYLLSGKLPFNGSILTSLHAQQVQKPLPLEQLQAAHVPTAVVTLLQRMLKPDPQDRPPSASALIDVLAKCQEEISPGRRGTRFQTLLTLLFVALIGGLVTMFATSRPSLKIPVKPPARPVVSKSLAVLPFENLNPAEQPGYFPVGVQQQLSSHLARLASLKVVMPGDRNQGQSANDKDYAAVGKDLGVDHLVVGSVRQSEGKTSIEVRLIDLRTPGTPWRKLYEQPLAEIFVAEARIVRDLAGRLNVDITPGEGQAIDKPPTTNTEAYDLYLQVHAGPSFFVGTAELREHLRQDIALLEKALALDPNFLLAYCDLASSHDAFASATTGATPEELSVDHRTLSEVALQNARRLDPEAGEVHLAYATHFYMVSRDQKQARIESELAARKLPNNSEIHAMLGVIARNQDRWDESVLELRKAVDLNPRDPGMCFWLIETYHPMRRYAELDQALARYVALLPDEEKVYGKLSRAAVPFEERGDLEPLRVALAATKPTNDRDAECLNRYRIIHALFTRDADALSHLVAARKETDVGHRGWVYPKAWFTALAARIKGDAEAARIAFEAARVEAAQNVRADPTSARPLSVLAMIDAGLGRKEEATQEAKHACEMVPPSKSAVTAPEMACNLAVVYAWNGQSDAAFALLEELSGQVAGGNLWYRPTYGDLKLSPIWDPLRDDPRFAGMVQRFAPRTAP